jgi:diguanylate cyclase (GGDEF)-like protein
MGLRIPDTLKRGVGRRIFGLFLLAGVLPVIVTAGLAWFEVHRAQNIEVSKTLHATAKGYGVDILSNLQRSSDKAEEVVRIVEQYGAEAVHDHAYLISEFEAIWYLSTDGSGRLIQGNTPSRLDPLFVDLSHLDSGASQFVIFDTGSESELILLRQAESPSVAGSILAFRLRPELFWTPRENTAYSTDLCAFTTSGKPLYCTAPMSSDVHRRLVHRPSGRTVKPLAWGSGEAEYLSVSWQLFLDGKFRAAAMDIVASQPRSYALRSAGDFTRVFVPALILVIILVGLLSLNFIGRSLVPLQRLMHAAKQFAAGQLSLRVRLRTDDEFEWLADAFNNMAAKLGRQIDTMEAMSEIDRMILSGASFGDVSEKVVGYLTGIAGCDAAAVIGQASEASPWARMISSHEGAFLREQITLPKELGHDWCQPRQVDLHEITDENSPYKARFLAYGQRYVVLIPVVLHGKLMGILLLGSVSKFDMTQDQLQRSVDFAGRFAVALASVEREEALFQQANFDELTGLPNRQLFKDKLEELIEAARDKQQNGAMLFLDLDRFKEINDVHGHSVGDIVLIQAAQRIVSEVREDDIVARLGGDEFVVLLPRAAGNDRARFLAERLLQRLTEVFSVRGTNHFVSASIGIVLFPDDGDSVETLLKNADAAMYRAKDAGRARYEFFSEHFNEESRRKIDIERDLRTAFQDRELEVYYQPQFEMDAGIISGAEALLRWEHAEHGFISPAEFIPLAEDSSLIVEIGRWVIEQTCRDLREILDEGLHPGPTSINVSARQLRDESFTTDVLRALQRHLIHPGFLQIEITETTIAQNRDTAIGILNILRSKGVRVALDDFGTGYSSLSYLQQLPFDVIKIDKSFVENLGDGTASDNICKTIIGIAEDLGKQSIAEGVETQQQTDFLRKNGCDFVQGFFHAQPMPLKEFVEFIRKQDFHTQRRKALEIVS